jgi:hypothetical protein
MPDRYRDQHGSILGFAVFVCLVIVALIGWYEGFKRGQESHQSASADAYKDQAETKIQETCFALSGASQTECIAEAVRGSREQQRSEEDLDAQQQMAEWARWMLIATVVMAATTGFGVVFVWQTLAATQQMAKDTRRIGEAQVRAYMNLASGNLKAEGRSVVAEIVINNFGQTPAKDMVSWVHTWIADYPLAEALPEPDKQAFFSKTNLSHGVPLTHLQPHGVDISDASAALILSENAAVYVYGVIKYADVFGALHVTRYCLFGQGDVRQKSIRLKPYVEGNTSD